MLMYHRVKLLAGSRPVKEEWKVTIGLCTDLWGTEVREIWGGGTWENFQEVLCLSRVLSELPKGRERTFEGTESGDPMPPSQNSTWESMTSATGIFCWWHWKGGRRGWARAMSVTEDGQLVFNLII